MDIGTSNWLREDDSIIVHRTAGPLGDLDIGIGRTLLIPGFGDYVSSALEDDWISSGHPVYPFHALGSNATFLIGSAPFHYPLGENSPLAKLYQLDGGILLVGADYSLNAAIHLAEVWMNMPYASRKMEIALEDGRSAIMEGAPGCSRGFHKIAPILRQARILRESMVDEVEVHFMRIRPLVTMAMEILRGDPEALRCDVPGCESCEEARRLASMQHELPQRKREW